jgi:hypothetical protein
MGFRIFVASPSEIQCAEAPPGVEEAYDLMVADRVPPQRAADMAMAAARDGKDPVDFARHFVKVRRQFRNSERSR